MRLMYFGARSYDPEVGVWTTTDPKNQLFNLYGYSSNPINTIDPNGEYILGAIIGGLAMGYLHGLTSSGSFNPGDWKAMDWFSAGIGAIDGAMIGSSIENRLIQSFFNAGNVPSTKYAARALLQNNASILKGLPAPTKDAKDAYLLYGFNWEEKENLKMYNQEKLVEKYITKKLEMRGYKPIVIDRASKRDLLNTFHKNSTRIWMFSGHHSSARAAIEDGFGKGVYATEFQAIGKGANLDAFIINGCYSALPTNATGWKDAIGQGVRFAGWTGEVMPYQTNLFNTIGVFDNNPRSLF